MNILLLFLQAAPGPTVTTTHFTTAQVLAIALCALLCCFGLVFVVLLFLGKIDITGILAEFDGEGPARASLAKFQFLVFTFVIAFSLFLLVMEKDEFPTIKPEILGLLGISAGSQVVSKAIASSKSTRLRAIEADKEVRLEEAKLAR
jgi:hypothetical protein